MWRPWLGTLAAAVLLISQSAFAQGTKVEVTVSTNPRDECAAKIRLIGGAPVNFTTITGKVARLTQPYTCACISQKGDVTYSACPEAPAALPAFIPGGVVPVTVCVSGTSFNCGT